MQTVGNLKHYVLVVYRFVLIAKISCFLLKYLTELRETVYMLVQATPLTSDTVIKFIVILC